jgi:hypothetical protein
VIVGLLFILLEHEHLWRERNWYRVVREMMLIAGEKRKFAAVKHVKHQNQVGG